MPWMPEVFTTPLATARSAQDEETTSTNDAVPYYEGILADEPDALVRSFAARQPVLDDPRVGYVEGTRELRAFATGTAEWLRERDAACWPAGAASAHHLVNHSDAPCSFLIFGTRVIPDVIHYPERGEILYDFEDGSWRMQRANGTLIEEGRDS